MAAVEIYDYLSTVTADNDVTLSVDPSGVVTEMGSFNDKILKGDDGSEERVRIGSDTPEIYTTLSWKNRLAADIGTVMDFFYNSSKGNGKLKSFKWSHPTDGHTYVVRFESDFSRTITPPELHGVTSCKLRVLGRIAD